MEAHPRLRPLFPPPLSFLGSTTLQRSTLSTHTHTHTHLIRCVHAGPNLSREPEEQQYQSERQAASQPASPSFNLRVLLARWGSVVGVRELCVSESARLFLSLGHRGEAESSFQHTALLYGSVQRRQQGQWRLLLARSTRLSRSSRRLASLRVTTACLVCTSTE